jgi:hypothetical protein
MVEAEALIQQARDILRDSEHAGVVPKWRPRRSSNIYFGYVQDIRATLGSLNAALPVVIEHLSQAREDLTSKISLLEARLSESESRSIAIKDDELRERCLDLLLRSGKADTAVRDATVVLEDRVRRAAQLGNEFYGTGLIDKALNPTKGALEFEGTAQEREGLYQLFRGTVGFFKNPTSHRIVADYKSTRARQVVGLIDVLLQLLQEARKTKAAGETLTEATAT